MLWLPTCKMADRRVRAAGFFFNAVRHTVTDRILTTYEAGMPRPDLEALEREAGR